MDPEYSDAEVTPEIGDNYLSAELMLPKGGVLVKGRVTARKHDCIRSAKQDDNYGASNIILPCPGN
jgi:hypothetical protein